MNGYVDQKKVMAIDPGKTCGYSCTNVGIGARDADEFLEWVFTLANAEMVKALVVERFHTRSLTPDSEKTIMVIGALDFIAKLFDMPLAYVNPDAKRKFADEVQDLATNRHARDAMAIGLWHQRYGKW